MVSVNNLSLYFGGQDIFKDISFMVNKGDKIGLVGKNGAGKSTLLKVLAKEQSPNNGNVSIPNSTVIGYFCTQICPKTDGVVLALPNLLPFGLIPAGFVGAEHLFLHEIPTLSISN